MGRKDMVVALPGTDQPSVTEIHMLAVIETSYVTTV